MWMISVSFVTGDVEEWELDEDEDIARELFRDTRRQFERAKNDRVVAGPRVQIPHGGVFHVEDLLDIRLLPPEPTQ
jgi:hypothetical protein